MPEDLTKKTDDDIPEVIAGFCRRCGEETEFRRTGEQVGINCIYKCTAYSCHQKETQFYLTSQEFQDAIKNLNALMRDKRMFGKSRRASSESHST